MFTEYKKSSGVVVGKTGILNLDLYDSKRIRLMNSTASIAKAGASAIVEIDLLPVDNIAKVVKKATASTTMEYSSLPDAGIISPYVGAYNYKLIKQASVAITGGAIVVTVPATSPLTKGMWVQISNPNTGASKLAEYVQQPLAIVKKNSGTEYALSGNIVPASVTVTTGKVDIQIIGFNRPDEIATPYSLVSKTGGVVKLATSLSEEVLAIDMNEHMIAMVDGNSGLLKERNSQRTAFVVKEISNDGTSVITVEDPEGLIDEAYKATPTDRLIIQNGLNDYSTKFPSKTISITGLKEGDVYSIELFS